MDKSLVYIAVVKLPYLQKMSTLRSKLSKGMGHNYMGEPAWPNDILYIFPVVITGVMCILIGLSVSQPFGISEPADPFATPLEILPEWYIFATFNLLRVSPSKLIGILSMAYVPLLLILVSIGENMSKYQSLFQPM